MKKFIIATLALAIVFLGVVVIYGILKGMIVGNTNGAAYSNHQIIIAICAESLRAICTVWLYIHHKADKSSLLKAIVFGLVCALLIGAMWIILGAAFLHPTDTISFIIDDSIILLLQGVVSGVVLWRVYKM